MKININHSGIKYVIFARKTETNSNYNISVSVYPENSKSPIFGTIMKEGERRANIINWVLDKLTQEATAKATSEQTPILPFDCLIKLS